VIARQSVQQPLLGLAALALALGTAPALLQPAGARAATTWEVQAGLEDMEAGIVANAYGPRVMQINVGDTVDWTFMGFHTVTFLAGQAPPQFITPGPGQGELTLGPAFFPLGPSAESASFDGSAQVSSGVPFLTMPPPEDGQEGSAQMPPAPHYQVTFTKPGLYEYVCTVHPGMTGTVVVAPAGAGLAETPAQAKERGQAELRTLASGKIRSDVKAIQSATVSANGITTHSLTAGLGDGFGGSAFLFLPGNITVKRGDVVTWTLADAAEPHTITFTSGAPLPEEIEVHPPAEGQAAPPTFLFPANVANPVGGTTYTGQGYLNSGLLFDGMSFTVRIDAPAGTYEYYCLLHDPVMKGTITVTE